MIVRSDTKVTKEIIEVSKSLSVIGRAGTGVDNIDVNAATKQGIIVLKLVSSFSCFLLFSNSLLGGIAIQDDDSSFFHWCS